jgi:hypothetical protein
LEGQRGQLISLTDRQNHPQLVSNAVASGARQDKAGEVIGLSTRALQRWRIYGEIGVDKRPTALRSELGNKLSQAERQAVIDVGNSEEFASLRQAKLYRYSPTEVSISHLSRVFIVYCMLKTCYTTEVKLSQEMSIKSPQVIPLKRRMKCGVGISATCRQR